MQIKTIRRERALLKIVAPGIFMVGGILTLFLDIWIGLTIYLIIATIGMWGLVRWLYGPYMRKRIRRALQEGEKKNLDRTNTITIDRNRIRIKSGTIESILGWDNIVRIEVTETHAYIYFSVIEAIYIPKSSILSGDFDVFISRVRLFSKPSLE